MNNNDYPILQFGKDFFYSKKETILTGKRIKKLVETKDGEAILKYPPNNYITSEVCSEKIAHELANKLNFDCARIELAECEDGTIGILSFLFVSPPNITHTDASAILKTPDTNNSSRSTYYTLSNIERSLNRIDAHLFRYFMRIMAFDALIGEQDRHEENWGILDKNGIKEISPLYDNGDSLVRDLAAERAITEYSSGIKRFDDYINRSRTCIYKEPSLIKEGESHKYKHFEMIDRLLTLYPALIQDDLAKISSLDDNEIVDIVSCIPEQLLTGLHKSYIIKYNKKKTNTYRKAKQFPKRTILMKNELWLIWRDPKTRLRYKVGVLRLENNYYYFEYTNPELDDASCVGFDVFPGFERDKHYKSESLFSNIKKRLPDHKRLDYLDTLNTYNLTDGSSDWDTLVATRGRIVTDDYEFVLPFTLDKIEFEVAGTRHRENYEKIKEILHPNCKVQLELEPKNKYDNNAIKICYKNKEKEYHIGYVPRFYSKQLASFLATNGHYSAIIKKISFGDINHDNDITAEVQLIFEKQNP